jgi:RHS repeat-associated protein
MKRSPLVASLSWLVFVLAVASAVSAQDANLRPTVDIQKDPADTSVPPVLFHPDLLAKANELGTPLRIFEFVHDEIEYEVYYGSKKGALGALWSGRGNDFDQASLLIGLLRARGYKARYVVGVVEVPIEQAKNWSGQFDTAATKALFIASYCWRLDLNPAAPLCAANRFAATDTSILLEHAWVEVEASAAYRGLQVGGSDLVWIPLDPSWKTKDYQAGVVLPIDEEDATGNCPAGKICFDYDGYLSQIDPRLPSEVWEKQIRSWLGAHPTLSGTALEDIPYDGPIRPLGIEVLPLSLPFDPAEGFTLAQTADLGTLSDGIPRRFRVQLAVKNVTGTTTYLPARIFEFPDLVPKRLTLTFEPTSTSRPTVLKVGGYLGGPWQNETNLAAYCITNPSNSNCRTTPVLKIDGASCGTGCTTTQFVPLASTVAVEIDRDLVPGQLATALSGDVALASYPFAAGSAASIGLDASHTGDEQFEERLDRFLDLPETLVLVDEDDDGNSNDDDNGNGVEGEVLLDRGSPGITSCTDTQYAAANAMEICDVAIAANFAHNDEFMGEMLHLGTLRYFQRYRDEQRRLYAIDRVVAAILPAVGITSGGLAVEYFFDRPIGVDASEPVMDIRGHGDLLNRIDAPTAPTDRETRLMAHIGSALEHQVWEEVTGREFISTVKGFQLARERFASHGILTSTGPGTGSAGYVTHRNALNGLIIDRSFRNAAYLDTLIGAGASGVRVVTPSTSIAGEAGYSEVRVQEATLPPGGIRIDMVIERSGMANGAFAFDLVPPSLLELDFFDLPFGDPNLFGPRSTTADPVSMVSGNNYLAETDLSIPTNGPPLRLSRSYNSQSDRSGALGFGWTHAFEMRIEPPRDKQQLAILPASLSGFKDDDKVEGARSDTTNSWNDGTGSLETVQWAAMPASFMQKVTVEKLVLDLGYRGAGIQFTVWQNNTQIQGPVSVPDQPGGVSHLETFDLPATLNLGSPFEIRFPTGFNGSDRLHHARVRVDLSGAEIERIELPAVPSGSSGWGANPALAGDDDDATCAIPGSAGTSVQSLTWPAPADSNGAFGVEVDVTVRKPSNDNGRATLWLGPQGTGAGFLVGLNPEWLGAGRTRFFTTNVSQLTTATYEAIQQDHVELCELRRTLLRIREQRDFVLETGARERFSKVGSTWLPARGVRSQLTEIAGGYRITRPDGSKLDFTQAGPNGSSQLTEISDAQGRSLLLAYDAGTQRLQSVTEEGAPARQLLFEYDANGHIDRIKDWSDRVWEYTVDAQGDLVEFRDPLAVQNGWPGVQYAYESGHVENPDLNHNLKRITHPEDRNGGAAGGVRFVEFTYFNDDKVASHTDALGNTQSFLFNLVRLENQTTDARGFTTFYRHDRDGNLVQRRDPDGAVWDWEYDQDRNVIRETDPFGRVRQFSGFDAKGNPGLVTDRDGKQINLTYDPLTGAPATILDKRGNTRAVGFTPDGLPETTSATIAGVSTLLSTSFYHATSRRLMQTTEPLGDGTGRVRDTRFFYEEPGDPNDRDLSRVESRDENGAVIAKAEYDYDALGRPRFQRVERETSASDPTLIQLVTETVWNARDQVERVIRPDGTAQVVEYDKNGNVTRQFLEETRPDGQPVLHGMTQLFYDEMDRLITSVDAAGGTTSYGYDLSGNRVSMTDPEGHTWRTEYDAMNRPIRVTDPNGAVTQTIYDATGRVVATIDATGVETRRVYDEIGRLVEYQYGDRPAATRDVFYGPGTAYREELTDPEGRVTKFEFDDLGRVAKTIDAALGETIVAYNLLGSPRTVTDPIGKQTIYTFDTLGRARTVKPYYGGYDTLSYDQTGNVIRRMKPDFCEIAQDYDVMGRLVAQRTINTAGSCDNRPIDDRFGYDARGLLVAAQNADVGLIREYDALGRLLREIDTRFGTGVGYAYDPASRLTSKVYPDGSSVHYAHDGAGRPVGISDPFGETTRFVYDGAGRRLQKLGTQGLRTEYEYETGTGWLTGVKSYTATGAVASDFSYPTHDDVGNRLTMTETSGGTTAYTYDALDRLSTLDPPNESIYPANGALTHFAYDAAGNRTDFGPMSGGSFTLPHTTYAYSTNTKRLTTITTTPVSGPPVVETLGLYDANGNPGTWTPPGGSARTLKFDALGRLVEITGGYSASYRYDPFGRRIEKTEQSTTTRYQYDGLDVVAEYGASQLEATYVFGPGMDEVLKLKRGTTVAAYHSDGLGSVVSVSDADNGGSLKTYRYDAFGKPLAQTGTLANAYTYTGRELDGSGLYYYRARYYLPSAGRFLTPDPIGLAGGINAYAYVSSNPVNYTDPFGLMAGRPFDPAWPELGGAFGQWASAAVAAAEPLAPLRPELYEIPGGGGSTSPALPAWMRWGGPLAIAFGALFSGADGFIDSYHFFETRLAEAERDPTRRQPGVVNLDTGAIVNFAAAGPEDPVVQQMYGYIAERRVGITQTALDESFAILGRRGGPTERLRWASLLAGAVPLPEFSLNVAEIGQLKPSDQRIFGTGAALGIPTLTTDDRFRRSWAAQYPGRPLDIYVVPTLRLKGL